MLVVLYHAGVPGFAGGYIGVDVFFVLSGFLITGILVKEAQETGGVDLRRFYARRALRLLPAAALLLIFVCVFAFLFYAPIAQVDIAKTAVATALYVSNFYFGQGATDYLAAEAETNPLLHTWSLGVEEQFYLVWPALVLFFLFGTLRRQTLLKPQTLRQKKASRRTKSKPAGFDKQRLLWGTVLVAVLSFALTLYLMANGLTHWAFFSSPSRVWEFALGALAVLIPSARQSAQGKATRLSFAGSSAGVSKLEHVLGWLGLAAIVGTGILYNAQTPFPGWAALLPVLGTVFVLRAGTAQTRTPLAKLLSLAPLRELGRISYSWYLWHWPPLVLAVGLFGGISLTSRLVIVGVSFFIAEASYRIVENPIRHNKTLGKKPAYGLALLAGTTLFSLGLAGVWQSVAVAQLDTPEQQIYAAARNDIPDLFERACHDELLEVEPAACSDGPEDAEVTLALYGDSHAAHWAPLFQALAEERGWRIVYFTKSSCAGIEAVPYNHRLGRTYTECGEWRQNVMAELAQLQPELIIMSSYALEPYTSEEWFSGSEQAFAELSKLADEVVIMRDPAQPEADVPLCLSHAAWQDKISLPVSIGDSICDGFPQRAKNTEVSELQAEAASEFANVSVLDLTDVFCPNDTCIIESQDHIMFRDRHHLSASYVVSLADEVEQRLEQITTAQSN